MPADRKTAYLTLMDVEEKKAFSNLALNHHIQIGKPNSQAFVRKLVYGVLENKMYLDFIVGQLIETPVEKMKSSDRTVLRMGLYQLMFMDSVPPYAAVQESVNLAKRYCRGREGFINAVLRNYSRKKDEICLPDQDTNLVGYLSTRYSYAPWIVELWLESYPRDFVEELLKAGNQTPDLVIRPNLLKTTKLDLEKRLIAKGYEVTKGHLVLDAMHVKGQELLDDTLFHDGMFSVQDESSMQVVTTLDPKPGELIVDVCAGPGGKTIYIAERMENRGEVIAQDIYKKKIDLIDRDAQRSGTTIVTTKTWDATKIDSGLSEKADRVLVDAPCSGLGVIRRKPEIKYKEYDKEMRGLPAEQLSMLRASSNYVKKGGVLVYSTCTINSNENQKVIAEFLKENPNFYVNQTLQIMPNIDESDGFYICKLIRR